MTEVPVKKPLTKEEKIKLDKELEEARKKFRETIGNLLTMPIEDSLKLLDQVIEQINIGINGQKVGDKWIKTPIDFSSPAQALLSVCGFIREIVGLVPIVAQTAVALPTKGAALIIGAHAQNNDINQILDKLNPHIPEGTLDFMKEPAKRK